MRSLSDERISGSPGEATESLAGVLGSSTENAVIVTDMCRRNLFWNEGARCLHGSDLEVILKKMGADFLQALEEVVAGKPGEMFDAALALGGGPARSRAFATMARVSPLERSPPLGETTPAGGSVSS